MCGSASSNQSNLAGQSGKFYSELSGAYNEAFADHESILNQMHDAWAPIFNAGIDQAGWSATEAAAINTRTVDENAAAYSHAANATAEVLAARGGGSEYLPSGVDSAIQADVAEKAAGALSAEENQNTIENYKQGRQNFVAAAGALSGVANEENPLDTAKVALGANDQAFRQATQINAENNSWKNDLTGALTGLAGSALSIAMPGSTYGAGRANNFGLDPATGQPFQTTPSVLPSQLTEPQ
jgi:hypothetical protein